jgi:zinc transport system substrate-binding protein
MNKFTLLLNSVISIILIFSSQMLFIAGTCTGKEINPQKINITASVFPLMEFAKAVCGERGEVTLLLPPGAEIHTWRPRPSDMMQIAKSDVFIFISEDLEPWLEDVLKSIKNPNLSILRASDSVLPMERVEHKGDIPRENQHNKGAKEHTHGTIDPHIWLDFTIDQRIIDNIVELISRIEPENSVLFHKNGVAYKKKLVECDRRYKEELGLCRTRTFILGGHAAFGYLAQKYNLHQLALYGVSPDSRPTPKQLIRIVDLAQEQHIDVIYFEVYVSDDLAKVIAEEVGAQTLVLNPGANLTVEQTKANLTFLEIMYQNLANLKKGLSCD